MQWATARTTPDWSAASIIAWHSASVGAIGFSTITCRPRRAAAIERGACAWLGVTMKTPSTAEVSISSIEVKWRGAPVRSAAARPRSWSRLTIASSRLFCPSLMPRAIQSRAKLLVPTTAHLTGAIACPFPVMELKDVSSQR